MATVLEDRPARPSRYASDIRQAAAAELAEDIVNWSDGQMTAEEVTRDLLLVSLNGNGYEIARELEQRHWRINIDAELVEILDGASSYLWRAHDRAVEKWVTENNVKPTLSVGDRIAYKEWTGAINGIREKAGIYLLANDDEPERYKNGGGICVPYEDAVPLTSEGGEA